MAGVREKRATNRRAPKETVDDGHPPKRNGSTTANVARAARGEATKQQQQRSAAGQWLSEQR